MTLKHSLLWLTGIAILTLGVLFLGREEVAAAIAKADPVSLSGLFLLQVVTLCLTSYQWQFLLRKKDQNLSLGKVLTINLTGSYVESVTPSVKLGGEAAKVYLFKRYTSLSYTSLTGMLLVQKYLSLMPFLFLAIFFVVMAWWQYPLPPITLVALLMLLLFVGALFWLHHRNGNQTENQNEENSAGITSSPEPHAEASFQKFLRLLRNKVNSVLIFTQKASAQSRNLTSPSERYALLGISTFIWLLYPVKVYLVTHMLNTPVDMVTVAMIVFTAYVVSMVPLLPGGLGTFEGTMVLLFTWSDFTPAQGLAIALMSRLVSYWFPLLLSAVAAFYLTWSHAGFSLKKLFNK